MRILQLSKYYPPYLGGIEKVAEVLSKLHTDFGDEVQVYCFGSSTRQYYGKFQENVHEFKTSLNLFNTPLSKDLILNFSKLLKKNKFDRIYVHLHNPCMHQLVIQNIDIVKELGAKVIGIYHSDIPNQKILSSIYGLLFRKTLGVYDKLIVSSPHLRHDSGFISHLSDDKIAVIPFPVLSDLAFIGRDEFQGNILAIGRLVKYKGFDFLINTIKKLNYRLTIIGDGPEKPRLMKIAKGHEDRIKIVGALSEDEKMRYINASDVLVISSINKSEAYGITIVEAFKAGLPVVASNVDSGVRYLVQHKTTGMLFDVKDGEKLVECLKNLEMNRVEYQSLAQNAFQFYEKNLSCETFKEKILKVA